jgi:hypothetical protein
LLKFRYFASAAAVAAAVGLIVNPASSRTTDVYAGVGPTLQSIGTLSFGSNGVLYAADPLAATVYALEVPAGGGTPGTKNVAGIDAQVAAVLGTTPEGITIVDMVVEPASRNSLLAVTRGTGADARPALVRVDGAGEISVVTLDAVKFTSALLPNPANANPTARNNPRTQAITDIAFVDGKLWVAGLSNEEFASKLWAIPYPFASVDRGTSVEIYHGNHGGLETRSPVYAFVPFQVAGEAHIIAGYLCTPLVKFPVKSLAPGAKITGTTIAELGAGNRPIDMIAYKKDGKDFILMSNTSRGIMKITTDQFATANAITSRIGGTAGVPFETVASMTGVLHLDLLDATHSLVISRNAAGALNLESVILP